MNRFLRHALATTALAVTALTVHAGEAGYVDLGQFKPADGCQYVEVNLHAPLLKFAAAFVDKDEPELAKLIRDLKRVRVNVVGYNDTTRADTTDRVQGLRRELEKQGWMQIVTVQQQGEKDADDVAIYVKMAADESVDGLVVTVLDTRQDQAVVVNIVGNIKPEQLVALGKGLHIEPLAQLRMKSDAKRS
ncbi:DUF4252 domain-containing protein [Opitutus terrae]|uniref:DUF4252 domain-containing protein n=1 Tax=Opitutus terrae (strain DSM 11246 / JCM 15787 / PB90-1) TaxID=452637 RepID=B1ZN01_OPITP|nr:DUF4252 domain-containing protein [Opitutus terrae]ACB76453.1 conserved hypothetical protein [Opitutus terrae PB90-1]